jgi:beta-glucanase (GH16 family)
MNRNILSFIGLAALLTACNFSKSPNKSQISLPKPPQDLGWTFETTPFWADEFDYEGLPDPAKWDYDIGGGGWGNNELQYYTNDLSNASVSNGSLKITAKKEQFENRNFTSTRLVSRNKGDFLYGRIEVRAIVPQGLGTWPAIWMLPTDWEYGGWPASGEIDVMEHVGYDPEMIHMSIHTEAYYWRINTQKTSKRIVEGAMDEYQIYRMDWTPYALRGYVNDALLFTFTNEGKTYKEWPFDKRFHLLLNIAVGGDWGGQQGVDESAFPASMLVDYVRYYRMNPSK